MEDKVANRVCIAKADVKCNKSRLLFIPFSNSLGYFKALFSLQFSSLDICLFVSLAVAVVDVTVFNIPFTFCDDEDGDDDDDEHLHLLLLFHLVIC